MDMEWTWSGPVFTRMAQRSGSLGFRMIRSTEAQGIGPLEGKVHSSLGEGKVFLAAASPLMTFSC